MEFLNLPRHIHFKICEYVDFKSRLSLMLINKEFYDFIGNTPGLCPKICIAEQTKNLPKFDRHFSSIKISHIHLDTFKLMELSTLLIDNAEYLDELILKGVNPPDDTIHLLNLVPKIKKLVFETSPQYQHVLSNNPDLTHNFPRLKTLVIDSRHSFWVNPFVHIFEDTAKNLVTLELNNLRKRDLCTNDQDYSEKTWKILHNKPQLKIFKIYSSYYEDFQVDFTKIQFQLTEISYYSKGGGPKLHKSIKNFKNFMKLQNCIENFDINIANKGEIQEMKWNLGSLLSHTLNLPSLKSFGIGLGDVTDLSIFSDNFQLPNVEEFRAHDNNSEMYLQHFPNVKIIDYGYEACLSNSYSQLNQYDQLQEIHLEASLSAQTLTQFVLPNLKKFHCHSLIDYSRKHFQEFLEANPSLVALKFNKIVKDHTKILEDLSKASSTLESFEITKIFKHDYNFQIFEIIGKKLTNLRTLKMGFLLEILNKQSVNGLPYTNIIDALAFIDKAKNYLSEENPSLNFELTLLEEAKLKRIQDYYSHGFRNWN